MSYVDNENTWLKLCACDTFSGNLLAISHTRHNQCNQHFQCIFLPYISNTPSFLPTPLQTRSDAAYGMCLLMSPRWHVEETTACQDFSQTGKQRAREMGSSNVWGHATKTGRNNCNKTKQTHKKHHGSHTICALWMPFFKIQLLIFFLSEMFKSVR